MVERMNNSLTQLIDVEKEVLTKVGAMFVSKRDAICNDSKRLSSMNITLSGFESKRRSAVSSIYDLNASIAKAQSEAAKALGSSLASMGNISLIEMVADDSHTEISRAYHVRAEVERRMRQVSEIKMTAQCAFNEANDMYGKLDDKKKELERALNEEQSHLKTAKENFINALQLLKGNKAEFSTVEKLCDVNFTEPSVPIDVATSIMTGLSSVNSSKTLKATEKLAEDYEDHVEQLKTLYTKLDEYNRTINGNATEAVKSAEEIEKNAKKTKKDAVETVVGEVNNKAKELCAAAKKLELFSDQSKKTTAEEKFVGGDFSGKRTVRGGSV
ncbi:hypothetical protein ERJ75_000548600 [Trypanosoma vivax]|uniref:Uncharacterized protein n=1 Tax=Trypanosoma vivax (strain Y486) TaxID=1055687 RepID=F9WS15_TRYVY|nr:hypothetical protein ERJ75_000548600 [Trypanosoma vivax]CCD20353.1 hypothetical protein, conserved in T. vivax [Trypanosoma vivax Y486]|eukprot:CCD20353.1 hypothetical protein, conserved in T. vivax [Trypanosoma vivax Y486]